MSPSLTIDSLHVRLNGVDPELARDAISRLGPALAQALAQRPETTFHPYAPGAPLTLPPVHLATPPSSAAALARRLADEILAATSATS